MRKLSRFCLFAAFALIAPCKSVHAWIFQEVPDQTVTVRYRLSVAANSSTAAVVIDLSSTTVWPHAYTGQINISSIRLDIDKVAASSGTVKIGVINFVDSSSGSVTWVYGREFSKNVSNTDSSYAVNFSPQYLKLKVVGNGPTNALGNTPYILSNDTTASSTIYQTDVVLPAPNLLGATFPGLGDVVVSVVNTDNGNAIVVGIEIQYHSER